MIETPAPHNTLATLEELQGPSEETKTRRRALIAEDEARLTKEDKQ